MPEKHVTLSEQSEKQPKAVARTREQKKDIPEGRDDIFSSIQWTNEDIENLLKENDRDCSKQSVDEFLSNFDIRHFEEQCIRFGWELLQSAIR